MSRRDRKPRLTYEPLKEVCRYVDQWSAGKMDPVSARRMIYRMLDVCQTRMGSLEEQVRTVVAEAEESRPKRQPKPKKKPDGTSRSQEKTTTVRRADSGPHGEGLGE